MATWQHRLERVISEFYIQSESHVGDTNTISVVVDGAADADGDLQQILHKDVAKEVLELISQATAEVAGRRNATPVVDSPPALFSPLLPSADGAASSTVVQPAVMFSLPSTTSSRALSAFQYIGEPLYITSNSQLPGALNASNDILSDVETIKRRARAHAHAKGALRRSEAVDAIIAKATQVAHQNDGLQIDPVYKRFIEARGNPVALVQLWRAVFLEYFPQLLSAAAIATPAEKGGLQTIYKLEQPHALLYPFLSSIAVLLDSQMHASNAAQVVCWLSEDELLTEVYAVHKDLLTAIIRFFLIALGGNIHTVVPASMSLSSGEAGERNVYATRQWTLPPTLPNDLIAVLLSSTNYHYCVPLPRPLKTRHSSLFGAGEEVWLSSAAAVVSHGPTAPVAHFAGMLLQEGRASASVLSLARAVIAAPDDTAVVNAFMLERSKARLHASDAVDAPYSPALPHCTELYVTTAVARGVVVRAGIPRESLRLPPDWSVTMSALPHWNTLPQAARPRARLWYCPFV